MAAPPAVFPVARRFIAAGKEVTAGTPVAPTVTLPMTTFDPEDKVVWLADEAWRNAMAAVYSNIQGVESGEISMGGPFFGDGIGYPLLNVFGDYYQSVTGTAGTPTTVATGNAYTAGAATLTITSASGFSAGTTFAVGALGTTAEEVRTVTSLAGSVITLNAPMYQNHPVGTAVTPYTVVTTYNHTFSLLNSGSGAGGSPQAQPPTYTYYDDTGMTASVGARCYPSTCISDLTFTGAAEALLMWEAKATSFVSQAAGSAPAAAVSAVIPQADWHAQLGIGGTVGSNPVTNAKEWKVGIARKLAPYWTNAGQQNPYVIGRGTLDVTGTLTFDPSYDESQLLNMLNNTQPQMQIVAVNGLSGTAAVTLTINIQVASYETAKITSSGELFGHDITFRAVANTTNAGPSGGYSPASVTVSNQVVNYG